MHILILGAGRVGESVAESLITEHNDITLIDPDPDRLRALEDRLDLRGVVGNGIQPSVLAAAGARDADLFIACALHDETNLVACKVAKRVFNVPTTIARLRSDEFVEGDALIAGPDGLGVDHVICPEESVMHTIHQLIDYPEALQVLEFSQGRAHLMAVRVEAGSQLAGCSIADMLGDTRLPPMHIAGLYRNDQEVALAPETCLQPGDEVFVLADKARIRQALRALHSENRAVQRVLIAGGGKVGLRLARSLVGQCRVKVIEHDRKRCDYLAAELPGDTLVLCGDASDEMLLAEEAVHDADLFIAVSNDDEDNILAALLAKRMGARRVIALVNRRTYAEMLQGSAIDITFSPAQTVLGELLVYVRRAAVAAVHSLRRGAAEAIEAVARGDERTSKLVGRQISQIKLPAGARVVGLVRGHDAQCQVLMPKPDLVIETDDHVILFLDNKHQLRQVERLFEVRATFF